jgi:hypothetical protein
MFSMQGNLVAKTFTVCASVCWLCGIHLAYEVDMWLTELFLYTAGYCW